MARNSITKRLREQNRAEKAERKGGKTAGSARFSNQNSRSIRRAYRAPGPLLLPWMSYPAPPEKRPAGLTAASCPVHIGALPCDPSISR